MSCFKAVTSLYLYIHYQGHFTANRISSFGQSVVEECIQ